MKFLIRFYVGCIAAIILTLASKVWGEDQPKSLDFALVVSNKVAAITAAGDPITLQELDKEYAEPPPGQNAAPLYDLAFAAFKNEDAKSPTFVADNIKALPLLIKAAERKSCRYPVAFEDGYSTKLPHLIKIKRAATLLKTVAVNQAVKERTDASTITLQAGISLARSLDNEPFGISKLVEFASLNYSVDGMEQAFTARSFSDSQLLNLQTTLKDAESCTSLRRMFADERALILACSKLPDDELAKILHHNDGKVEDALIEKLAAYRKSAKFHQDIAFTLDYMSDLVAISELPYPQSLDAEAKKADTKIKSATEQGFIFSETMLSAMSGYLTKGASATANIRIALTALAIERYRLKHTNALPGTLADLMPDFIQSIPADPFDGQPMRYKTLADKGYVVYSIGKDRKDDGGAERASDGKTPLDVTFTVKR